MKRAICFAMISTLLLGIIGCDIKEKPQSAQEALESVITEELINPSIENPENSPEIEINENKNPNSQQQTQIQNQKPPEPEIKTPQIQEKPLIDKVYKNLDVWGNDSPLIGYSHPAYMVTSQRGYNRASMDIDLSKIQMNAVFNNQEHKYIVPQITFRLEVFNTDGTLMETANIGLSYNSAGDGKWHFVYKVYSNYYDNIYIGSSDDDVRDFYQWVICPVDINPKGNYRIIIDGSNEIGKCSVNLTDLKNGKSIFEKEFELFYLDSSGSNIEISQLFFAQFGMGLYSEKTGTNYFGNPNYKSWNTSEGVINESNTIKNLYIKNMQISNIKISKEGDEYPWTEDINKKFGLWPSKYDDKVKHNILTVQSKKSGQEIIFDLNFNN